LVKDDGVTATAPIKERFAHFCDLLADDSEPDLFGVLRAAESTGRALGDDGLPAAIERTTLILKPSKRGPKPAASQRY
jgi:putative transposase